jgi:5'-phosphate synthase pdxT subunit
VRIGILAVQGDVSAHAEQLRRLRVDTLEVRTPAQLKVCGGLILPGGESTTQLQFLEEEGLLQAIRTFATKGAAIFGTCAGAILLAKGVRNPVQASLGLLDVTIVRNAYGRQMSSEVSLGATTLKEGLTEMVFIRAPIIESVGTSVEVLASYDGNATLVQSRNILAATFHPELSDDATVHRHFLSMIARPVLERRGTRPLHPEASQDRARQTAVVDSKAYLNSYASRIS